VLASPPVGDTPAAGTARAAADRCTPGEEENDMGITGIISALVVGLIIGALARLVVPGRQPIPIWLTIVIGIIGAVVGTFLAQVIGVAVTPGIDWIEILLQVAVAAAGVAIAAGLYRRRSVTR
jgi:uncharacterized membrane protein YeaQ/YmgE (transglycosylase-associated protein family)